MGTPAKEKQPTGLYAKLLLFQQQIHGIKKDAKNPHFKSNYASLPQILSEVKPLLSELGLILLQPIADGKVETTIIDSETGDKITSDFILPSNGTPQQIGSAITYYRRYLLAGMLSLEIEDDDANTASKPAQQTAGRSNAKERLEACTTLEDLGKVYTALTSEEKAAHIALKDALKAKLTQLKAA